VQENSDPGHPDDCMLVTDNNDDYPLESLKAGMSEKLNTISDLFIRWKA
jgi:hypothetical protein